MPASPLRILLIGAGGQLGRELWPRLRELGNVLATVRRPFDEGASHHCLPLDLTDDAAVRRLVHEVRPHLVVNAAAYTAVDQAEQEPHLAMAVNNTAPDILAREARRIGAALLHYSTDYVFDGRGCAAWCETDQTTPLNAYGRSKLAGEEAIRNSGVPHLIVRTSWVYGVGGRNFAATMLRLGAERRELRVVADQIGSPTSAAFVAAATARIVGWSRSSPSQYFARRGGVVHLACGGETSWHGFAAEVFRQASACCAPLAVQNLVPIASRDYPATARRPLNSRLDLTRLHRRFGIVPPAWQTALAATLPSLLAEQNACVPLLACPAV